MIAHLTRLVLCATLGGTLAVPISGILPATATSRSDGYDCAAASWFDPNGWGHYAASCNNIWPGHKQRAMVELWRKSTQQYSIRAGIWAEHDGQVSAVRWRDRRYVWLASWISVKPT